MLTRLFAFASRVRALFARRALDADFASELGSHLDMLADDHERRGLPRDEALRQARLDLGGTVQLLEDHRANRGLPLVETTLHDGRYAVRTLRQHPGYAAAVTVTLAIGIGAVTSMFTVVRAVLLRPLPFAQPDQLIEISETNPLKGWTHAVAAPANVADWRARNTVFTDIAAYSGVDDRGASLFRRAVTVNGEPVQIDGIAVTGNLFGVLGVAPLRGRTFTWDETFDGHDRVIVLSYGTWQNAFAGDPAIVGREISLSGRTVTIIGVMPAGFFFPNRTAQFWAPLGLSTDAFTRLRRPHFVNTIARLRTGATIDQARDQMTRIARDLERQYPDTNTRMGVRLEPLHDIMASDARPTVLMLFGAVTVLFLIVCANIASLQLSRGTSRVREIAVRRALGAPRMRIVRQLLTEALLLSLAGAALGIALASRTPALLLRIAPSALPLFATARIDVSVLTFSVGLAIVAPLAFGLMPAIAASRSDHLADRADTGTKQTRRARDVLVAGEVALSIVLIVASLLLTRSLLALQRVDAGFAPERAMSFEVTLPRVKYPKDQAMVRLFTEVERQLRVQPGVVAVGATTSLVLRGYAWTGDATVEGRAADDYERELRHESVTPDYFRAVGTRLIAGRLLTDRDGADSAVTLVNEALANKYFPGVDPVGKRIKFGRPTENDPWVTIVGVVADAKQDGLDKPVRPEVYVPYAANVQNPATFVVRSSLAPDAIAGSARQIVRGLDRDALVTNVTSLDGLVRESTAPERFRATLLSTFASVALFLAAVGIYGVLAYSVAQRSRELGIRLALGARPSELFAMVVRQGMVPVVAGAVLGLLGAVVLTRLLASLLFGINALDPVSYASTIGVLVITALGASAMPAARATHVDPLVSLRDE
jgi:putative ABC transport system permease protein